MNEVYALIYFAYIDGCSEADVMLFSSIEAAQSEMKRQYEQTIELWKIDGENLLRDALCDYQSLDITDKSAWVSDYPDDAYWRIERKEID